MSRSPLFVTSLLLLAVMACAPAAPPAPPAPAFEAAEFFAANCAACHGADGWGTQAAPPLVGVPVDELQATVRDPDPRMPTFGPGAISDADLAVLAVYVNALTPPTVAEDLMVHLEAAKEAAEQQDQDAAELHLEAAIEVAPEELKGALEFILEEAEEGEFEEVEEFIGMLLGEEHP